MRGIDELAPSRVTIWIVIIALVGAILRIAAAGGSLWLDEAWSALLADTTRTPLGVFVQINHDNNHHLNSLWLQLVGIDAPPLFARALSVVASTLGIVVAGLIGARRGAVAGLATALLFALSPAMVTLGSEARGYAPMMLSVLVCIWYLDRYLAGEPDADRPATLAICFFVGALFQLTMVFAACALVGWPLFVLWRRHGWRRAARDVARLLGPALLAIALALAISFAPTLLGDVTFQFGNAEPFTLATFQRGLDDLLGFAFGVSGFALLLPVAAVILAVLARSLQTPRLAFYWLAILAFPLTVAALQMMNPGHARYYLLTALALLLLAGELIAKLLRAGGWRALGGGGVLLAVAASSMAANAELIRNQRGSVDPAVQAMAARSPAGARVALARETGLALIQVAAAQAGYRVEVTESCQPARFVFADRFPAEGRGPTAVRRCGTTYRAIAEAIGTGMSAQNWTLYERVG